MVTTMNKKQLFEKAKAEGIEELEIFESTNKKTSLDIFEQNVDHFTISDTTTWKVRGVYQGQMGKVIVEDGSDFDFIIDAIKENATAITSSDEQEIYAGDEHYPTIQKRNNTCFQASSAKKVQLMKTLERELLESDARIAQVMEASYVESCSQVSITNSKGLCLAKENQWTMLGACVLAKDKDDFKSASEVELIEDLDAFDLSDFVKRLKEKAVSKLHAVSVHSGHYPIIIDRSAMAQLLQCVFAQFHGDQAAKGISLLSCALQQSIFDEKVTLIDDPLLPQGVNCTPFDDEGVACQRKVIVDHGVLLQFFHNLKSSKKMQAETKGNGFHGSIDYTNFYMENGDQEVDELIKQMDRGIIVTDLAGLHAGWNAITTQFSIQASGFFVEHGKIAYPINLFTIAGNFLKLMKQVDGIGNDLKHYPSGIGAPSVLFPNIAISGS